MSDAGDVDEDLFADLYADGDDVADKTTSAPPVASQPPVDPPISLTTPTVPTPVAQVTPQVDSQYVQPTMDNQTQGDGLNSNGNSGFSNGGYDNMNPENYRSHSPIGIKEDGKMFIGGLNWETTDQSLRTYFEEFGEVLECTVMRDGATGRSRGFGFLTFKDPKTVNTVMVKEHYLDGKIIDPKRAIPRDEQEKTSKIFVGGVSQEATEKDFEQFFFQFGRVIDATLMMDKDTGRPRGFGFVTFDSEAAVEKTLERPLEIMGKMIEVKKAQPRGNMRDENEDGARGGKFNRRDNNRFGRDQNQGQNNNSNDNQQNQGQNQQNTNGMSPAMMAQYWQRMQQYFVMMQNQMASGMAGGGMGNMMAGQMGGQMNPMMQQQMMQQMSQMQGNGGGSPMVNPMGNMNNMSPQQMQNMAQQGGQGGQGGEFPQRMVSPTGSGIDASQSNIRPAFNAQEQLAFEQRKYEQQQARRGGSQGTGNQSYGSQQYNQGGPTSWDGMYDDVPQPNMGGSGQGRGGGGRNGPKGSQNNTPQPSSQAPLNAPTGPKNPGKTGPNYRGGGRRGGHGFHPYSRNG